MVSLQHAEDMQRKLKELRDEIAKKNEQKRAEEEEKMKKRRDLSLKRNEERQRYNLREEPID